MKWIQVVTMPLFLWVLSAAEENQYSYVFSSKTQAPAINYYAGLTFEHHATITNTKPGLELGILWNRQFLCGVYGQGTSGNFGVKYRDTIHNIMFGEGGVVFGMISEYHKTVHFGGLFKIGFISLTADDEEMKLFKRVDPIAEDAGLVFHPEVFAEANFTRQFKFRLGLGYTFNSLDEESVICNRDLDSWTMNLSFLFGNFWR